MSKWQPIIKYYEKKLAEHGAVSHGVDWNGDESQLLRFAQFLKLLPKDKRFSLLDYGCGYGAFSEFLKKNGFECDYTGYDLSEKMIAAAKEKFEKVKFVNQLGKETFDFVVASGVLNVKGEYPSEEWREIVVQELQKIDKLASLGFAFNCLTSYSDADKQRDHLFYGDPCFFFDFCKKNFSKQVALLHDYGLYEFTILVRK